MSLIKDTKLGIKLSLAFFVVVAVFVAVAAYQIRSMDRLGDIQAESATRAVEAEEVLNIVNRIESLTIICSDAIISRNVKGFTTQYAAFKDQSDKDMARLNQIVDTEEETKNVEAFSMGLKAYEETLDKKLLPYLDSGSKDLDEVRYIYARIIAFRDAARNPLEKIAHSIQEESHAAAQAFDDARRAAITTALGVAGLGVLAAVLVAAVMTLSITRPLKKATAFALDLAAGAVDKDLPIRQRDEVGEVCWALRRIAESLRSVLGEFAAATGDISLGRLRSRGDSSTFKGAFADLIGNANRMADTLVNYLDMVPSPITTLDNEHAILFINKAGAQAGNADPHQLQGTKCYDHFKTGDCNTPGCACTRAMEMRGPASSETTARPGNSDLEIVYAAVPITDAAGNVVGAFEMVTDQTEIKRAQKQMHRLADQAQGIASNLSSAAEELSAQVEESSRGSDIQRERAAETATAMEEMNSTVMAVAHSASNAAKAADATQAKAREGARNVEALVAAVLGIKAQMDALSANMAGLGQQAEGISRVLNVISDIADQTNLLALNAAIEAARAGDAGRGFAVVADEVRKLAEKTMTATQEVGDAITAIQDGARRSIGETQKAAESVAGSAATAQASGAALNEIVALAEETADQVRSIAAASEQQSASSEQINRSTEEINRISTETAETMGQSAQAVVELARLAQQLGALIQEMNA